LTKAVWDKAAYLEIIDHGWGNHAFIMKELKTESANSISAISIDDIKNNFNIDHISILKIDIEGSEEQVFLEEPKWIKKIDTIFCEIHENLKHGLTNKITSMLASDFNIYKSGEYHVFKIKH